MTSPTSSSPKSTEPPSGGTAGPSTSTPLPSNGAPSGAVAEHHQLPPHRGKLSRIQTSAEGAVEAMKEWVELRIELARAEIEEAIAEKQLQAKFGVMLAVLGVLAVFMLLLVAGFGASATIEALLGWGQLPSLTAGYGFVLLVILIAALLVFRRSPFGKKS